MSEICQKVGTLNVCFDPSATKVYGSKKSVKQATKNVVNSASKAACPQEFGKDKECNHQSSSFQRIDKQGRTIKFRTEAFSLAPRSELHGDDFLPGTRFLPQLKQPSLGEKPAVRPDPLVQAGWNRYAQGIEAMYHAKNSKQFAEARTQAAEIVFILQENFPPGLLKQVLNMEFQGSASGSKKA